MQYDRAGVFHYFPIARLHFQEPAMRHAVGRHMRHEQLVKSFEPDDVCGVVRLNFDGRHCQSQWRGGRRAGHFSCADREPVGGLQFVEVNTRIVVLASDVTHFYENMESERPFTTASRISGMLDAYDTRAHAPIRQHTVSGQDSKVMRRGPPPQLKLEGIVMRLDVAPNAKPAMRCVPPERIR